jgi:hypothetical protein
VAPLPVSVLSSASFAEQAPRATAAHWDEELRRLSLDGVPSDSSNKGIAAVARAAAQAFVAWRCGALPAWLETALVERLTDITTPGLPAHHLAILEGKAKWKAEDWRALFAMDRRTLASGVPTPVATTRAHCWGLALTRGIKSFRGAAAAAAAGKPIGAPDAVSPTEFQAKLGATVGKVRRQIERENRKRR